MGRGLGVGETLGVGVGDVGVGVGVGVAGVGVGVGVPGVGVGVGVAGVGVGVGVTPPQLPSTLNTMCMSGNPRSPVGVGTVTPQSTALR